MYKTVTNYYLSILKRQKKLLFLYTVIGFVAFPMVALISTNYDGGRGIYEYSILMYAIFMGACALIMPIVINKFMLNKRSVDTYFSLPISRKHLFDVHFFAGLTCIYVPLLLNYLIGILLLTFRYGFYSFTLHSLLGLFGIIIITMAIYSINTLIVTKANNMIDSAILIAAYVVLPFMLYVCSMSFVNQFTVGFTDSMFDFGIMLNFLSPFTILNDFVSSFNDFIRTYTTALEYNLLWIAYEALIIVGFYFWAVNVFKKRKGEDSEQVSNDFFTYPLVVNLSSVLLLSMYIIDITDIILTITIVVITFILYLIMHFISRRSMKVTPQLIIKYFVILAAFNVFAFAAKETYFFGINLQTPNVDQFTKLEVSYYDYDNDWNGKDNEYEAVILLSNMNKDEEKFVNDILDLQKVAAEEKKNHIGNSYYYVEDSIYLRVAFKVNDDDYDHYYRFNLPREDYGDLLESKCFKVMNYGYDTEIVD
ncbi:ABC transporter permease [Dielma fastidiosa]|uniref:Uncharacterized protein n=1 Tax=Dielma fastidiosa TaxID=1034346 RepID=A0A318KF19_9FIRM|nr:ABC transporter permease [Dielma fastidiosa]PXX75828.1 hypothetical protein DES51_11712 [Dielma fastidiosa]RHN01721.1 ABC transporter permease [Dielma fastidiosa]